MSKQTLSREILRELNRLNSIIDLRIIKGLSYNKESRRHRFLLSQLASLRYETYIESENLARINRANQMNRAKKVNHISSRFSLFNFTHAFSSFLL